MSRSVTIKPGEAESPFDRQERIGWWRQSVLRDARVLVVGAGALGNEALKNLALLGVGRILVVDFDTISTSNLSRTLLFRPEDVGAEKAPLAALRARELALDHTTDIRALHADLVWDVGLGVFRRMDVVLGCVDNDEARLAVNRAARSVGVPWINAGIYELSGGVTAYSGTADPCFECHVTPDQVADARSRYDSCEQVKKRFLAEERVPTVQVASAIVSGLQIQEAVKILHGEKVDFGIRIAYNGFTNGFHRIQLPRNEGCLAHGLFENVVELPARARETTVGELLDLVEAIEGPGVRIELGRRYLRRIRCRSCGRRIDIERPTHRVFDDELYCGPCRTGTSPSSPVSDRNDDPSATYMESVTHFTRQRFGDADMTPEIARRTLWDLGIPPLHVLTVRTARGTIGFHELTGDAETVLPGWG